MCPQTTFTQTFYARTTKPRCDQELSREREIFLTNIYNILQYLQSKSKPTLDGVLTESVRRMVLQSTLYLYNSPSLLVRKRPVTPTIL